MEIPVHLQAALGIASPVAEDALIAAADKWAATQGAFGLSGRDFTAAVVDAAAAPIAFDTYQPCRGSTSWKYLELSKGGSLECIAVCTPTAITSSPPTATGQVLVKAWLSMPALLQDTNLQLGLAVRGIVQGATLSNFARRLVSEWSEVFPLLEASPVPPSWITKSEIGIAADARLTSVQVASLKYDYLLVEAVSEVKSKWRFLSLYRILEHGYLSEVFHTLCADFFAAPKQSLTAAQSSIDSELKQFLALATKASLKTQFETFHDEFDKAKIAGNQLALALELSCRRSGQLKDLQEPWQKGVLFCYKIRCAIVHAGLSAPIFDAFTDGPALLEHVLPTCESITLAFLGVTIV